MADLRGALEMLVLEPGIGSKVETPGSEVVRRLYLGRIHYFIYDGCGAALLKSLRSGMRVAAAHPASEACGRTGQSTRTSYRRALPAYCPPVNSDVSPHQRLASDAHHGVPLVLRAIAFRSAQGYNATTCRVASDEEQT
ncbi:MAG: hypothetical protein JWP22_3210 [Ramlibacter sp.]|nr:hypothetical protein [Ramlibacter sp.]